MHRSLIHCYLMPLLYNTGFFFMLTHIFDFILQYKQFIFQKLFFNKYRVGSIKPMYFIIYIHLKFL